MEAILQPTAKAYLDMVYANIQSQWAEVGRATAEVTVTKEIDCFNSLVSNCVTFTCFRWGKLVILTIESTTSYTGTRPAKDWGATTEWLPYLYYVLYTQTICIYLGFTPPTRQNSWVAVLILCKVAMLVMWLRGCADHMMWQCRSHDIVATSLIDRGWLYIK